MNQGLLCSRFGDPLPMRGYLDTEVGAYVGFAVVGIFMQPGLCMFFCFVFVFSPVLVNRRALTLTAPADRCMPVENSFVVVRHPIRPLQPTWMRLGPLSKTYKQGPLRWFNTRPGAHFDGKGGCPSPLSIIHRTGGIGISSMSMLMVTPWCQQRSC